MSAIAMLAPVPLIHLEWALEDKLDPVAFGSEAWDVLKQLPEDASGDDIPVLIYASMANALPYVTWTGIFDGWLDPSKTPLDELLAMRPSSTRAPDNPEPLWGTYWKVRDLERLPDARWVPIAKLTKRDGSGLLKSNFIPEGPILVEAP